VPLGVAAAEEAGEKAGEEDSWLGGAVWLQASRGPGLAEEGGWMEVVGIVYLDRLRGSLRDRI